jgi:hypothetical protein
MQVTTELELQFMNYKNTAECNDMLWKSFTERTDGVEFLKTHRDWVEHNSWGYGARAFHYMWYLLLKDDVLIRHSPSLLEIGVYKGQVISLWALIAEQLGRPVEITAISPFEGSKPWFALKLKKLLGRAKRVMMGLSRYLCLGLVYDVLDRTAQSLSCHFDHYLVRDSEGRSANFYEKADYNANVNHIFRTFSLQDAEVTLVKGYSQDDHVRRQVAGRSFDIVYIDGGHRLDEVSADLRFYAPLVRHHGYLVVDDASCNLPGTTFWKGHASVSRAVEDWGALGFANVLNIGHNRVYMRNT